MPTLPTIIVALVACTSVAAEDVTGRASVIDGDTIEVHGERVRLFGIDAPGSRQLLMIVQNLSWLPRADPNCFPLNAKAWRFALQTQALLKG